MFRPAFDGQIPSLGYRVGMDIEADLGLELTTEQRQRIVRLYEVDRLTGARLVRRAALRRPKGCGKSPEAGYIAYAELVLPVVFNHWRDGQPVGSPHPDPWVQLAAVSEDQTDNVMVWLFDILADRPDVCERRGIDLGRTRIYLKGRPGRIEPVTAAAGSREGQRVTFGALDQTESWTKENGGRRLADVLRRNAAKMGGWTYELQNAPEPGDGSVADSTARAAEKRSAGVFYDAREAPEVTDLTDRAALLDALRVAYGEAVRWVNLDRLADEIQDPDTDPSDARRYYLNQATPSSDRAFDRKAWTHPDRVDATRVVGAGEQITLGFDGSRKDDATAIVACHIESGHLWLVGLWERPERADDTWEVPEADVHSTMAEAFDRYDVVRLYADPYYWGEAVNGWEGRWGDKRVVPWPTNSWRRIGFACHNFATAITSGALTHSGESDLTRHVLNAVRKRVGALNEDGQRMWTLAKSAPALKIDAAMAAVLAWEARSDAIAAGALHQPEMFVPRRIR
jgi:hypothetical protein